MDVSNKKLRWNLWLRFEFFYVLHQMMQELVTELSTPENRIILPPFPEKRLKLFTDHFNEHFIENRRMLLDNYLQKILANRYLRHSEIFISFLTPPDNEELDTKTVDDDNKNNNNPQLQQSHNQNDENKDNAPDEDDNDSMKGNDDDIDSKMDQEPATKGGDVNGLNGLNNGKPLDAESSQAIINKFMALKDVEFVGVDQVTFILSILIIISLYVICCEFASDIVKISNIK